MLIISGERSGISLSLLQGIDGDGVRNKLDKSSALGGAEDAVAMKPDGHRGRREGGLEVGNQLHDKYLNNEILKNRLKA